MSVHYIIQKNINHQQNAQRVVSSIVTHSYMFRPCWVIFREKLSVVVTLGRTIQLSENVLLTVHCATFGGLQAETTKSSRLQKRRSGQSTAHSRATV
jgi:hypothetical protein